MLAFVVLLVLLGCLVLGLLWDDRSKRPPAGIESYAARAAIRDIERRTVQAMLAAEMARSDGSS